MKTTRLTDRPQRKLPGWSLKQWVWAIILAFFALTIIGLVIFFFFPNRAI
ncbi:hypothetical protein [Mucilaginibacter aquariorum]|uniref:Uncharacterized protein n=1 Tax=Mucilaginibacter aquariorum TaxID=2967225 RepID=A0ABT1T2G8_9SPHI|nr:hypothetical protein [Mucilaginibacter aquariorum]MCQ6958759.1 hypothetical protein [Mucilaginibacter aquariorum]